VKTTSRDREAGKTVVIARAWPVLADGDYVGVVEHLDCSRSPFPPKRRADGEKRDEWRLYLHIRLTGGTDARTEFSLKENSPDSGARPVVFASYRYTSHPGRMEPIAPPTSARLFKLLAMAIGRPLRPGDEIDFERLRARTVRVRVGTVQKDSEAVILPRETHYSIVRRILGIVRTSDLEPETKDQLPPTHHQLLCPREGIVGTFEAIQTPAAGSGVESPDCERATHNRPGLAAQAPLPGPTPNEIKRRIRDLFGTGADVVQRTPCPRCEQPTFARFGENPRCLWCV
jgi:hypothetical protein